MADDDLTPREIAHELARFERDLRGLADRGDRERQALDDRITGLARDTVPLVAHQRDIAGLQKEIADHEADAREAHRDIRAEIDRRANEVESRSMERYKAALTAVDELRQSSRFSRQQWVGIASVVAALAAAFITVWLTSKGGK